LNTMFEEDEECEPDEEGESRIIEKKDEEDED
jgi:hypothetical protein